MNKYRWLFFTSLLVSMSPMTASAQTGGDSRVENFRNCLNAYAECNVTQLSLEECQAVVNASSDKNLENCLASLGACDESLLSPEIKKEVECANHLRNLDNCLDSLTGCDQQKLTAQEQRLVSSAARDSNLQRFSRAMEAISFSSRVRCIRGFTTRVQLAT
jgi:hypothetical protein